MGAADIGARRTGVMTLAGRWKRVRYLKISCNFEIRVEDWHVAHYTLPGAQIPIPRKGNKKLFDGWDGTRFYNLRSVPCPAYTRKRVPRLLVLSRVFSIGVLYRVYRTRALHGELAGIFDILLAQLWNDC